MTGRLSKNFHGVGIGPLSKILAVKCNICDFKTAQKGNLKTHIESVHEGIKAYNCNICGWDTSNKSSLNYHMEYVHDGIKGKNLQ